MENQKKETEKTQNVNNNSQEAKPKMSEAAKKRYEQAFRNALSNFCIDDGL